MLEETRSDYGIRMTWDSYFYRICKPSNVIHFCVGWWI